MPTVSQAIEYDTFAFLEQSKGLFQSGKVFSLLNPIRIWQYVLNIFYVLVQSVIIWSFKPVRLLLVNFPHFIEVRVHRNHHLLRNRWKILVEGLLSLELVSRA